MNCLQFFITAFIFLVVLLFVSTVDKFKAEGPIFHTNIEQDTIQNDNYRKILYTNKYQQVGLMTLLPGEDIPKETHDGDQFFRIEKGDGVAIVGDSPPIKLTDGSALVIPAGVPHYVKNTSDTKPFQLYTIYSPPQHKATDFNMRQPIED